MGDGECCADATASGAAVWDDRWSIMIEFYILQTKVKNYNLIIDQKERNKTGQKRPRIKSQTLDGV